MIDFDGETGELSDESVNAILEFNSLVHRVFEQNEDGKRLLGILFEKHVMSPIVIAGEGVEAHGIREGQARLVRQFKKIVALVDNNYNQ